MEFYEMEKMEIMGDLLEELQLAEDLEQMARDIAESDPWQELDAECIEHHEELESWE